MFNSESQLFPLWVSAGQKYLSIITKPKFLIQSWIIQARLNKTICIHRSRIGFGTGFRRCHNSCSSLQSCDAPLTQPVILNFASLLGGTATHASPRWLSASRFYCRAHPLVQGDRGKGGNGVESRIALHSRWLTFSIKRKACGERVTVEGGEWE